MKTKEFNSLVEIYGEEKSEKAVKWFVENHSEDFRKAVRQAKFCQHNEYLWF